MCANGNCLRNEAVIQFGSQSEGFNSSTFILKTIYIFFLDLTGMCVPGDPSESGRTSLTPIDKIG